jgi:hypothetical protein
MLMFVDGKRVDAYDARRAPKVRAKAPRRMALDGAVLDAREAAAAFLLSWRSLFGGLGFAGLMLIVVPLGGIMFAARTTPLTTIAFIAVPSIAIGIVLLAVRQISVRRRWDAGVAERVAALAPPGTPVRLDEDGVAVSDVSAAWAALTVQRLDLNYFEGDEGEEPFYRVERITLAAGDKCIVLDRDLISGGQALTPPMRALSPRAGLKSCLGRADDPCGLTSDMAADLCAAGAGRLSGAGARGHCYRTADRCGSGSVIVR